MNRAAGLVVAAAGVAAMAACRTAGPAYQRPEAPTLAQWETPAPWRPSTPADALPKGAWWKVFHDDGLDALESDAVQANQTLAEAAARYDAARAVTAGAVATEYPLVTADPSVARQRLSGNRPANPSPGQALTESSFTLPVTATYEADLFGGRRRTIEQSVASLQANAAALENARLVVTADLATDYFGLKQTDTEIDVLDRAVQALERGLALVQARRDGGIASGLDVAQEETLLESTRTQATLVRETRDQFEHAIADLTGRAAGSFHVPTAGLAAEPPAIDLGLPSDLLERRPDVAEAERAMAAANAGIGVAMSAYFPSVSLFGSGGWQSTAIGALFGAASTLWSIGAAATQTIFDGGAISANVRLARADYSETVAEYRESVLTAFREVEDAVSGMGVLHDARISQDAAVAAAGRALDFATTRYEGGLVNYLDVVSAQETLFGAERLAAQLRGQELVTSVDLVKALGGGWDAASLAAISARSAKSVK